MIFDYAMPPAAFAAMLFFAPDIDYVFDYILPMPTAIFATVMPALRYAIAPRHFLRFAIDTCMLPLSPAFATPLFAAFSISDVTPAHCRFMLFRYLLSFSPAYVRQPKMGLRQGARGGIPLPPPPHHHVATRPWLSYYTAAPCRRCRYAAMSLR